MNANLNRVDVARRDLRDLKGLGPLVATAQGPRPFKSRRPLRTTSNLYIAANVQCTHTQLSQYALSVTPTLLDSVHKPLYLVKCSHWRVSDD